MSLEDNIIFTASCRASGSSKMCCETDSVLVTLRWSVSCKKEKTVTVVLYACTQLEYEGQVISPLHLAWSEL